MSNEQIIKQLDKASRNLAAVLRRIEQRELTGRNSDATERAIAWHLKNGRQLVTQLCESDADETLIAKPIDRFWRVERRVYGIEQPVA